MSFADMLSAASGEAEPKKTKKTRQVARPVDRSADSVENIPPKAKPKKKKRSETGLAVLRLDGVISRAKYEAHRTKTPREGEFVLPLGFLSSSQVEMYLKCPKQYEFRYVEGLKMPPALALAEGGSHHVALNHNNLHKVKTGRDLKSHKVFSTFADAFGVECKRVEDWEGESKDVVLKRGEHMIRQYLAVFAPNVQPICKESIEYNFVADIAGVEVRGVIDVCVQPADRADRVVVAKAATLTIIDYKTGKKARSQNEVLGSIQLGCYGTHLLQNLPSGGKVDVGFCVLKKTMNPNPISYTGARMTRKRIKDVRRVVVGVAKSISLGSFPRCDPSHWICDAKYCGYYQKCHG